MSSSHSEAHTLQERALALARPLSPATDLTATLEVMVFASAGIRYALETRFISAVARIEDVAPVPGAAHFVRGLIDFRGELLVVVDLADLLNRTGSAANLSHAIVCGALRAELGLGVEDALDVRRINSDEILPFGHESSDGPVRGLGKDGLVMLDGAALLSDERLWVRRLDEGEG